jgi:hypothetical protein
MAGAGPEIDQAINVATAMTTTEGTNQAEIVSTSLWIGARDPLRFRDHGYDLGEECIAADPLGAHDETARRVDGGAGHLVAGILLGRHRLAGNHGFIDRAAALEHHAVDRHFLAGPHAQAVAGNDFFKRDVLVAAIIAQPAGAFRRQIEQGANGAAGLGAGAELEHLAEQNQRDDYGRRLKIKRHLPVMIAEGSRKNPRRQRGDQAIGVSDASAERDQREHVEPAADDRRPAALKERPAAPQHRRRAQDQLPPNEKARGDQRIECRFVEMLGHGDGQQRQRERDTDPEAPRHVAQFRILGFACRRRHRFQRHAADRAIARFFPHDLRMHRTGPQDLAGSSNGQSVLGSDIARRIGGELFPATGAAEDVAVAGMLGAVLCRRRIDAHPADRVAHLGGRHGSVVLMAGKRFGRSHLDRSLRGSFQRWKVYFAKPSSEGRFPLAHFTWDKSSYNLI